MSRPIRLTRADADAVHPVVVGTTIELALVEIPTTGFQWSLSIEPQSAAVATNRFVPGAGVGSGGGGAKPARPALGAGGERVFALCFAEAESVSVALTLRREWAPLDRAADSVTFTFAVT